MELISIHVPKTAGTAFTKVLTRNYGEQHIYLDYVAKNLDAIGPDIKVIHGHFAAKRYEGDFPEAKRIAWIRHPVKWMISFYYYSKNGVRLEHNYLRCTLQDNNLSLAEFIELPRAHNILSTFFRERSLDDFYFLGVQEHFDADLKTLGAMLGWKYVDAPRDNTNVEPGYRETVKAHLADTKLVRRIEELNALDMDLYEQIVAIRARRPPITRSTEPQVWVEPRRPLILARGLTKVRALLRRPRAA